MDIVDVIVIGAGPAGLAGATALGRSLRDVLVVDAGSLRNAAAAGAHNVLTRDGTAPGEIAALGRREAEGYGVRFVDGEVVRASVDDGLFRVRLASGDEHTARRLLVTAGAVDVLPDLPGLAERWGHDVVHCPYCHGHEVRGTRIGVLATSALAGHSTGLWRQLSEQVVLLTNASWTPDADTAERFAARGVRTVHGRVTRVVVEGDRIVGVELEDGGRVDLDTLAVASRVEARAGFLATLGLEPEDVVFGDVVVGTRIAADPTGRTTVPGVWAAGNVVDPMGQVVGAAAAGLMAGAQINADLVAEETAAAVDAARAS